MGTPEKYNLLLFTSYAAGLFGGILLMATFGKFLELGYFPIVLLFAVIFSLPLYALANILFSLFYAKIQPKIEIYAILSPLIVVLLWLIYEYCFHQSAIGTTAFYDRVKLAFVCSSISAIFFLLGNLFIKAR
ncbi:hypothetical protein [Sneathiella sp. HT1-7]|uniref:hypothetical protein n=1 Tax=Sneathiella sp. HT1-7 TaxID=2887192 RepID=UPI001D153BBC|nr:hypothetical protein [Sneathiella sp. HT1-7]MCC3305968.1 hypothetical protein [Sneathiella sp. HT1-7]